MKKLVTMIITAAMILTAVPAFAGDDGAVTAAATKPGKVQELKVLKNGYKSLKVTWKAVVGADIYQVYRSKTGKSGSFALKKTTTGTTYTNTGITCGKTYYYKVRAVNNKGKGAFSVVKSSRVQPATAKITKVTIPKDEQVRVHWNKVSGATGYQVYRKRADKSAWKLFRTVSNKYTTMTDKMLGNKSYPWGKFGPAYYDYKDLEYSWEYKVRAYRTVNGKKVYGYFSNKDKWVPDWTIDEIFELCWKYGESLKFPLYEYANQDGSPNKDGDYLIPKKDGSIYHMKHVIGWNPDLKDYVYTNPANGNTEKGSHFEEDTSGNYGPNWPVLVNPYRTKASVMKSLKENIKYELGAIAAANPLYWATINNEGAAGPNEEPEYWNGVDFFGIYCEPYLNGYKVWLFW